MIPTVANGNLRIGLPVTFVSSQEASFFIIMMAVPHFGHLKFRPAALSETFSLVPQLLHEIEIAMSFALVL